MTRDNIFTVSQCLPVGETKGGRQVLAKARGPVPGFDITRPELNFAINYRNLQFAWDSAGVLARTGMEFPNSVFGEEYFWKAYLWYCDADTYYDPHIEQAALLCTPPMERRRQVLNGLLVSEGMSCETAGELAGVSSETVKAYSQLFFDIGDRLWDHQFISEIVYPDSRLVEVMRGFVEHEHLGDFLMKSGYNNGPQDVMYFAGMKTKMLADLMREENTCPQKIESFIFGMGYLLSRNNIFSQESMFGVAKGLLNSQKISGADTGKQGPISGALGDTILRQMMLAKNSQKTAAIREHMSGGNLVLDITPM
jgi:hypothetical protein